MRGRKLVALVTLCVLGGLCADSGAQTAPAKARQVPGLQGAIKIPFALERDAQTTLGLYNKQGQMVRILGQLLELKAGRYEVAWDGMDLWGNLVPAGTELTLKVITNPGIKAFYEFSVADPGNPPWISRTVGEGDARRAGGWLGDHTGPGFALGVGNKMFLSSKLTEHGHNLIATTLNGEKMWGAQLAGWSGPSLLTTDGTGLYALIKDGHSIQKINPETFEITKNFAKTDDEVQAIAAHGGKLTLVMKNREAGVDLFARAKVAISNAHSLPTPGSTKAPAERMLSPAAAFSTVFTQGGSIQTGITPVMRGNTGFVCAVFEQPVQIGTLVLGGQAGVDQIEAYVLKGGVKYDPAKHAPKADAGKADDMGEATEFGLSGDWELLGKTKPARTMNLVTAPRPGLTTSALYLRLTTAPKATEKPRLTMCRILPRRVAEVAASPQVVVPGNVTLTVEGAKLTRWGGAVGWDFRTAVPVSDVVPAQVVVDLKQARTFAGIGLYNTVNPKLEIQALAGDAEPDAAPEAAWKTVTSWKSGSSKDTNEFSSSVHANDVQIAFPEAVTTRALRIKYERGIAQGRGAWRLGEDMSRVACGDIQLLKLVDPVEKVPGWIVQTRDGGDGKVLATGPYDGAAIAAMAYAPSGELFTLADGKLCKSAVSVTGGVADVKHTVLYGGFKTPVSLAVSRDRIAVGDTGSNAIYLFDHAGKLQVTLGEKGGYKRGAYDPAVINRPSSVAFGADGSIWMAEEAYHPKRIARFGADGRHIVDFFGPPEYGGGGWLDPDLTAFYYRGQEFALDFARGTSYLRAFNDRFMSPESPVLDAGSFTYTHAGRVIVVKGRKYAVDDPGGSVVVCLLDEKAHVWKPAAVMGSARGSMFLTQRPQWRAHWLSMDLKDQCFIWVDKNGDGTWQVDEVELFKPEAALGKNPFGGAYWGSRIGPDLTVWTSSARLAVSRFTDSGVPVYEARNLQPYKYPVPVYLGNLKIGALAKRDFGNASIVLSDGSLMVEGQPYVVKPDMTLANGAVGGPSDYRPAIQGYIMDNPLGFVGSAVTNSPVGEVAIMNGDNGDWPIVSAKLGCVVGRIFTGKAGGFGGLAAQHGVEVTDHKQDWETFFGHFLKAANGKYYVVAGKGYHGISRLEGLDDYKVAEVPVKVTPETLAANTKLRPVLTGLTQDVKTAKALDRQMAIQPLAKRTIGFKLDGDLGDWGPAAKMVALNEPRLETAPDEPGQLKAPRATNHVAMAYDDQGLYLAFSGIAKLANTGQDYQHLFKTGFSLDFQFRTAAKPGAGVAAGDRRIVIAPYKGQWAAVRMDYVDPAMAEDRYVEYVSPVLTTRVAKVELLPTQAGNGDEKSVAVAVRSGVDAERRAAATAQGRLTKGQTDFAAEVFLPWSVLGLKAGQAFRCDLGILSADAGGMAVGSRNYWSNQNTDPVTDEAQEAATTVATHGAVSFEK